MTAGKMLHTENVVHTQTLKKIRGNIGIWVPAAV